MKVLPGKPEANLETAKRYVEQAVAAGAHLVVFPAFCISGSLLGGLAEQGAFLERCRKACDELIEFSSKVDIAFGGHDGLYYAKAGKKERLVKSSLALSEKEMCNIIQIGDLLVCAGCVHYIKEDGDEFQRMLSKKAKEDCLPLLFVNAVGSQNTGKNIYGFAGGSLAFNDNGSLVATMPLFEERGILFDVVYGKVTGGCVKERESTIAEIHKALVFMIRENLNRFGVNRVVIGASGGIDSAVSAALYVEAIGKENVFLINMPTRFNSDTTKNAARDLADNLGTPYMVAPISDILNTIGQSLERCSFIRNDTPMKIEGINYENLQARIRSGAVLASVASVVGAAFTCNGNKSEVMVGYCTLYGDTCGVMCALGDLWKTEVYALAHEINKEKEIIPVASIDVPASAELSDAQNVDEGKGDPVKYPYHDRLFAYWIEKTPRKCLEDSMELLESGVDRYCKEIGVSVDLFNSLFASKEDALEDMKGWYRRFSGIALAKRIQLPPVLTLTRHAFGHDIQEVQI